MLIYTVVIGLSMRTQTVRIDIVATRAWKVYHKAMKKPRSVFEVHDEKLHEHELQMGPINGKLAVLLDLLTDSMIVAGKHGIYCRNKQRPDEPSIDMQLIQEGLQQSKELVQAVMDQLRKK